MPLREAVRLEMETEWVLPPFSTMRMMRFSLMSASTMACERFARKTPVSD
jgi:hypothetical protein